MDIFGLLTALGFIVAATPHAVNGYRYVSRSRAMKSFWDGQSKDYVLVYPVHEDPASRTKDHRLIKHEAVSAARQLEEFLKAHGCRVTVRRSIDGLSDVEKQSNVVILGSSRTNPIVASSFPELEQHFGFGVLNDEYYIVDKHTQVQLVSPIDKGLSADLALIVKIPNRNSPQLSNRVYYLAGVHAIGCWAAADYLTDHKRLRKLPRCSHDVGVALVIEATFSGFYNLIDFNDYVAPRLIPAGK